MMASEDANSSFDGSEDDDDLEDLTAMLSIDENDTDLIAAIEAASPTSSPKANVELGGGDDSKEGQHQEDDGGGDGDDHLMSSLMEAISDENFGETNIVNDHVDPDDTGREKEIDDISNDNDDGKKLSNTTSDSSPAGGQQNDNDSPETAAAATAATTSSSSPTDDEDDNTKKKEEEEEIKDEEKVPLQQFMNAMTIIQDLEARVAELENERELLLVQNEQQQQRIAQYDEENLKQQTMIEHYEKQLSKFPDMMEDWFETNAKIVEKNATEEAKSKYWDQHMKKEEARFEKEKQQLRTDNLKQSDFLKNLVGTKDAVEKQSANWQQQSPQWLKRLNTAVVNIGKNNPHPWTKPLSAVNAVTGSTNGDNTSSSRPNIIENLDSDDEGEEQSKVVEPNPNEVQTRNKGVLDLVT